MSPDEFRQKVEAWGADGSRPARAALVREAWMEPAYWIAELQCSHCEYLHVDQGELADDPHKTHLCRACGKLFGPVVYDDTPVRSVGVRTVAEAEVRLIVSSYDGTPRRAAELCGAMGYANGLGGTPRPILSMHCSQLKLDEVMRYLEEWD